MASEGTAVSIITRSRQDAEGDHMAHLPIWFLLAILTAWQYLGPSIFRSAEYFLLQRRRPSITSQQAPPCFGNLLVGRYREQPLAIELRPELQPGRRRVNPIKPQKRRDKLSYLAPCPLLHYTTVYMVDITGRSDSLLNHNPCQSYMETPK